MGKLQKYLKNLKTNLIQRKKDPESRCRKIVKLTPKGIEKTDNILKHKWENIHDLRDDELKTLKRLLFKFLNKFKINEK